MELKNIVSPTLLKKKIREWVPKNCPFSLCKTYVQNIGFMYKYIYIYIYFIYVNIYINTYIMYILIYVLYIFNIYFIKRIR